jgi:hypothetical protein
MHSTDNPKGCLGSTKMGVGINRHILFGQMGSHGNKRKQTVLLCSASNKTSYSFNIFQGKTFKVQQP